MTFSPDKTVVPADYALDDRPKNVEALLAAGVEAHLVDQPWNRDANLPRTSSLLDWTLDALQHPAHKEAA